MTTTQEPGTRQRAVGRKRRWPRRLLWTVIAMGLIFYVGGGWYFADQLRADGLRVNPNERQYRATVASIEADTVTIAQGDPADGDIFNPGLLGLIWENGYGTVGEVIDRSATEVTRRYELLGGEAPTPGTLIDVDPWVYPDEVAQALGLDIEEVTYESPLGPMAAVLIPGSSDTWAVLVHGKNATPRETFRMGAVLAAEGYPLLSISHRNDRDQPGDPSGFHQFGATEWEDLEGAVQYAINAGADEVVLVGYSTGGAVVLSFLEQSQLAGEVRAAVLDSPNIDFGSTVDYNASRRNLPVVGIKVPSSLTWVAKRLGSLRFGIDWGAIDYISRAEQLKVPVLVLHGTDDPSVPIETSRNFATARPDLVTLIEFEGGKHVQSWNIDSERYEQEVIGFFAGL